MGTEGRKGDNCGCHLKSEHKALPGRLESWMGTKSWHWKHEVCKNIFPSAPISNSRELVNSMMVCSPAGNRASLLSSGKKNMSRLRKDLWHVDGTKVAHSPIDSDVYKV